MTNSPTIDVPPDWPRPSAAEVEHARRVAVQALDDAGEHPATRRLSLHYDRDGRGAGTTFLDLPPAEPGTITVADLHALTVLQAGVDAQTTRRLLDDHAVRETVEQALAAVPEDLDLSSASVPVLEAMDAMATALLSACKRPDTPASNPWVTTAKLCSRKRPRLFPVRDRVVCAGLGLFGTPLRKVGDRRIDWQVYAALVGDTELSARLDELTDRVESTGVSCDSVPLRVLDVALWTHLRRR